MDKILVLFVIGITVGIFVPLTEKAYQNAELLNEPLTAIQHVFVGGTKLWHLAISVLVLISLPAAIFKTIRNRMSKKQFMPIPFMTGISFGFTLMAMVGLFASIFQG
jgi:hypothetical protein